MSHRFRFLGEESKPGTWILSEDEAHHLQKVLRLSVGTEVEVTNGRGLWALGVVQEIKSKEVLIATESSQVEAEHAPRLILAIGALKPGGIDEILPMLTELGADEVLVFGQDDAQKSRLAPKALERWQRILIQAVKQSKRSRVPTLRVLRSVDELIASEVTRADLGGDIDLGQRHVCLLNEHATQSLAANLRLTWQERLRESEEAMARLGAPGQLLLIAGGEKGFSGRELALFAALHVPRVKLGPFILRAVTAAVAAMAVAAAWRASRS